MLQLRMLQEIPSPKQVLYFNVLLGGSISSDKHANLKYRLGNRHFGSEGYYVITAGMNEARIKKEIQEQEKHDIIQDKLSVKEYENPFKD